MSARHGEGGSTRRRSSFSGRIWSNATWMETRMLMRGRAESIFERFHRTAKVGALRRQINSTAAHTAWISYSTLLRPSPAHQTSQQSDETRQNGLETPDTHAKKTVRCIADLPSDCRADGDRTYRMRKGSCRCNMSAAEGLFCSSASAWPS